MELGRDIRFRDNAIAAAAATTFAIDAIASIAFPLAVLAFAFGSRFPATTASSAVRDRCLPFHAVGLPRPPRPSCAGGGVGEPTIGHGRTLTVAAVVKAEDGPGSDPRLKRSPVAFADALPGSRTASPGRAMPERFLTTPANDCDVVPRESRAATKSTAAGTRRA